MKEKSQVEMIKDVLVQKYDCDGASAITEALAYCIFGVHSRHLVHCMESPERMANAITPQIVRDNAGVIDRWINALYTRLASMPDSGPR